MADDASGDHDMDVVLRMMDGDQDALRDLLMAHGSKARAYLKKKFRENLADPEIDEAMNVAAFNAFRFADRFDRHKGSLGTWFTTIAIRAAQSIIRGEEKHRYKELEYDPEYDPARCDESAASAPADKVESRRIEDVREAMRTLLTPAEREIVREDLAAGEGEADDARLAQKTGRSKNSVQSLRSKAHRKIEDYMVSKGHYQATQRGRK